MTTAEKNLFIKKMQQESGPQLASTLHYFRLNSEPGLMPYILKVLEQDCDQESKDAVAELCMDIKSPDLAIETLSYALSTAHIPTQRMLLEMVWQIGQDVSPCAARLADFMAGCGDFGTAFNCFTILDCCCGSILPETALEIGQRLETAAQSASGDVRNILLSAADCARQKQANRQE